MKAKRMALTSILSLGLLVSPGPQSLDLIPGPRGLEAPLGGVEEAYAQKCTESVCVKVNFKIVEITLCRSREYNC